MPESRRLPRDGLVEILLADFASFISLSNTVPEMMLPLLIFACRCFLVFCLCAVPLGAMMMELLILLQ